MIWGFLMKYLYIFILLFFVLTSLNIDKIEANDLYWQDIYNKNELILKQDEKDLMAKFKMAISLANMGQVKESYDLFNNFKNDYTMKIFSQSTAIYIKKLRENKKNILLLNIAAFSKVVENDYKEAVDYFLRILDIESENIWIQNYLAASYIEISELNKARELLTKAIKIQDNKYSHLLLGMIHYKNGEIFKSLYEFSQSGDLLKYFL